MNPPQILLASGSPYRAELLKRLQLPFEIFVAGIDESPLADETTTAMATRLAREKAAAVQLLRPASWIIGSDQVADLDGNPIGKPGTREAAVAQLARLSGKTVYFHTAVCLLTDANCHEALVTTRVTYRELTSTQISRYLDMEPAFDCAGSAKSEGLGIALISELQTPDPTALVGLPLIALTGMLADAGYSPIS